MNVEEEDSETYRNKHFWDSAIVGGRYFAGCLWRDRHGLLLPVIPSTHREQKYRPGNSRSG